MLTDTSPRLARDVQAEPDARGIAIDEVGIRGLRYPAVTASGPTIAIWQLTVGLPADQRGTHMSRFVAALDAWADTPLDGGALLDLLADLQARLDAEDVRASCTFTLFLERLAPISGLVARHGIDCTLTGARTPTGTSLELGVRVPVTTLCPCSKEISEYGAHNQRGYVTITARVLPNVRLGLEELIAVAEGSGSAVIYPLLKRVDERHVTMQAYDSPTFVEDVVRNAAVALIADERVRGFEVEAENHESIHDHAAIATIRWERS